MLFSLVSIFQTHSKRQTSLERTRLHFARTNYARQMFWIFFNLLISVSATTEVLSAEMMRVHILSQQFAQSNAAQVSATKPPVVEWITERDHDFGKLRHERPKTFVFKFKNLDSEPIMLQTVRTSCGCTAATWTETPIAPGESGEIVVEYDAYQRGEFKKKIRVFFDRQRKPEILWIRGEVD